MPSLARCVTLAVAVCAMPGTVRAQRPERVVYVGERGPLADFVRAELALVELELGRADVPAPTSANEARTLLEATESTALVVLGDPTTVWTSGCAGLRPRELSGAPGTLALLVAELISATRAAECPSVMQEDPWRLDSPEPVSVPLQLVPPPPRLERAATRPPRQLELGAGLAAGHDFGGARPTLLARLDASVRVHRSFALSLGGSIPLRTARVDLADIDVELRAGTIDVAAKLLLPFPRIGRFEVITGPSLWWMWARALPRQATPREGHAWTLGWHVELALHIELHERVAFRLHTRLTTPLPPRPLVDSSSEVGRVGPQLHSGLGFVFLL